MLTVISNAWALLLGMLLLMVGNGLQGTLLGVRGEIENFSTLQMSVVMSAYFAGFLVSSQVTPGLIRRVGHVRVFAALASTISAVLILFPLLNNPYAWIIGRVIVGFGFCGVYIVAESWLNNAATNETRGQTLSAYMIVQMAGVVAAQGLLLMADPAEYTLFIVISVLVSLSFLPILLSISPTPAFDTTKPMSLAQLIKISPLGCVGMFLLGGVFAAQFGMSAVYGVEAGLSVAQISIFVSSFYVGALVLQYPLGWMSDRMDRRSLIMFVAAATALGAALAAMMGSVFVVLCAAAFLIGGMSNPLYSLLIAHTNDFLEPDDMAAASGGLLFINGVGAVSGPLITGWAMSALGSWGFFLFIGVLMTGLAGYAAYRRTQRAAIPVEDTMTYAPVSPSSTSVAVEFAQEYAVAEAEDAEAAQ
ncbi:MFS transporter [Primorskyibacter sp. S187A]|uniref:MFS transporter n=1 Tax=Primorskyibacter sp. S187A TaxID=3415130 RepID=UPI003C7D1CFE